jgi:hypothetical protein
MYAPPTLSRLLLHPALAVAPPRSRHLSRPHTHTPPAVTPSLPLFHPLSLPQAIFKGAMSFNQPLGWDVAKVVDMHEAFHDTSSLSECNKAIIDAAFSASPEWACTDWDCAYANGNNWSSYRCPPSAPPPPALPPVPPLPPWPPASPPPPEGLATWILILYIVGPILCCCGCSACGNWLKKRERLQLEKARIHVGTVS